MLEQSREIVTAMCKFRKKVWNREGKLIRWEDHKHATVGGKEKDREKGNSEWVEQLRQITNKNLREIGGKNYLIKFIQSIQSWAAYRKKRKF